MDRVRLCHIFRANPFPFVQASKHLPRIEPRAALPGRPFLKDNILAPSIVDRLAHLFGRKETDHAREAFVRLYDRAHLMVFRYIYGMYGGPMQDVEDLTAETFLRAWGARDRFTGDEEAAIGWLFQIARRLGH